MAQAPAPQTFTQWLFGRRPASDARPARPALPGNVGTRRDPAARAQVVAAAEATWRDDHFRPFMAWLTAQVPSTDSLGPGSLRFATDTLWMLPRFYVELYATNDLGFEAADLGPMREELALHRRDFEIVQRFLAERFPRATPEWVVQPFQDDRAFWAAFRAAAHQFERGLDDGNPNKLSVREEDWVAGLSRLMAHAISWANYRPAPPAT